MRSAFQGKPSAPAPQKTTATRAAIVQASPHVASAVAVNRSGSARGPVFEGEFVDPTAAAQRRSSPPPALPSPAAQPPRTSVT
jgi:hypothetical protein